MAAFVRGVGRGARYRRAAAAIRAVARRHLQDRYVALQRQALVSAMATPSSVLVGQLREGFPSRSNGRSLPRSPSCAYRRSPVSGCHATCLELSRRAYSWVSPVSRWFLSSTIRAWRLLLPQVAPAAWRRAACQLHRRVSPANVGHSGTRLVSRAAKEFPSLGFNDAGTAHPARLRSARLQAQDAEGGHQAWPLCARLLRATAESLNRESRPSLRLAKGAAGTPIASSLGSVEIQDSTGSLIVIQACDGSFGTDRRPVGEDGTALPG